MPGIPSSPCTRERVGDARTSETWTKFEVLHFENVAHLRTNIAVETLYMATVLCAVPALCTHPPPVATTDW